MGEMKLDLSAVTLVCYDNKNREAALSLILQMLKLADFGGVLWLNWHRTASEQVHVELYGTANLVHTTHFLTVRGNSYILHPDCWDSSWLEYDYIGAPWLASVRPMAVGNGAFSLRSRRLYDRVAQLPQRLDLQPDYTVCCYYRKLLEAEGFRWAPVEAAAKFCVEHPLSCTPDRTFGKVGCSSLPVI
ncbi:MAG: hypothetical protein C5B47_08880 [Verrucomicrobia bacterium]|nr:MAG: hypothetical protein C5B47_08880 [Verrucomicrobiota bacterium]